MVATVSCQAQGVGQPILVPGPRLPPLPWLVRLVRRDGTVFGETIEDGNRGPRMILVRGEVMTEDSWPNSTGGFEHSPCAS